MNINQIIKKEMEWMDLLEIMEKLNNYNLLLFMLIICIKLYI